MLHAHEQNNYAECLVQFYIFISLCRTLQETQLRLFQTIGLGERHGFTI